MRHRIPSLIVFSWLVLSGLSGCALRERALFWAGKPLLSGAMQSLMEESDPAIARTAMESELKLLEGLLTLRPKDPELLEEAAQGFSAYAMLFLEDTEPRRASLFYLRSRDYGMRRLALYQPNLGGNTTEYPVFEAAINKLPARAVPAAYWTAISWGGWVNLNKSLPAAIADMPRAVQLMRWVMGRDSIYFHAGPMWFFGVYYASLPPILGGDLTRSATFFKNALSATDGQFLWGKYLYARYYLTATGDRAIFQRTMSEIGDAARRSEYSPDLRLVNAIAAQRSDKLAATIEDYFPTQEDTR